MMRRKQVRTCVLIARSFSNQTTEPSHYETFSNTQHSTPSVATNYLQQHQHVLGNMTRTNNNWTGEASTSSGIVLLSASFLLFLLSLDMVGLFSIGGALQSQLSLLEPLMMNSEKFQFKWQQEQRWWTDWGLGFGSGFDSNNDNSHVSPSSSELASFNLPLSVLLSLTSLPALSWLIIKYVSLRLHLGRNWACVQVQSTTRTTSTVSAVTGYRLPATGPKYSNPLEAHYLMLSLLLFLLPSLLRLQFESIIPT